MDHNEEYPEINEQVQRALENVMKHRVIDGEVYVSVAGIKSMIETYADGVVEAAMGGLTCQHGVSMGSAILDNLDGLMNCCVYLHAADLVPDTVPDDIITD